MWKIWFDRIFDVLYFLFVIKEYLPRIFISNTNVEELVQSIDVDVDSIVNNLEVLHVIVYPNVSEYQYLHVND